MTIICVHMAFSCGGSVLFVVLLCFCAALLQCDVLPLCCMVVLLFLFVALMPFFYFTFFFIFFFYIYSVGLCAMGLFPLLGGGFIVLCLFLSFFFVCAGALYLCFRNLCSVCLSL